MNFPYYYSIITVILPENYSEFSPTLHLFDQQYDKNKNNNINK